MNNKYIEYKSNNDPMLYFLTINKKLVKKFIMVDNQLKFPNFVRHYSLDSILVSLDIRRLQEVYVAAILSNFLSTKK